MLITLGAIEAGSVDYKLVLRFTLGVMVVFLSFGLIISYINENLLNSEKNVRGIVCNCWSFLSNSWIKYFTWIKLDKKNRYKRKKYV